MDTAGVIQNSNLSPADKLREYRTISAHPLTQAAWRECTEESAAQSRRMLLNLVLKAGAELDGGEDTELRTALQALLPACGQAVTKGSFPVFLEDEQLLHPLLQDNADLLLLRLLACISENRHAAQYSLAGMVRALAADKPLLCQMDDEAFLRKYAGIYCMVWQGETLSALEEMTGLLLEERVTDGREAFLQLYTSLAAVEEQGPAFIFGKLQLGRLYLRQGRREACRAAVDELTEMGAEGEELARLRRELRDA